MDEKEKQIQSNEHEQLPEDFRPVIPEPEYHRRAIMQFSKDYEDDSPTSTHTMSFQQEEARRKLRNRIVYALVLIAVFVLTFIITDTCIKISNTPLPPTTAYVPSTTQEQTTQAETSTTEDESITIEQSEPPVEPVV